MSLATMQPGALLLSSLQFSGGCRSFGELMSVECCFVEGKVCGGGRDRESDGSQSRCMRTDLHRMLLR